MPKKKENRLEVVNVRLVDAPSLYSEQTITSPEDVIKVVAEELKNYDREVFAILNLKARGEPINLNICSVGTLTSSLVSPREVFKASILSNAAAFIAIHNHPSGNAHPSEEDKLVTQRLMECGDILDIQMSDHIIIAGGSGEWYSFHKEGLVKNFRDESERHLFRESVYADTVKEFTDRDIIELLSQVNDKLKEKDQSASILLSGGASISLMFNRERLTQDVDAVLLSSNKGEFRKLVAEVGAENGLKDDWLNDAVKGFIDLDWQKELLPTGFSNLTVYSVPADKLLAMKLNAGRRDTQDKNDAIDLMRHLDIKSVDQALDILEDSLPKHLLTAKTKYFAIETFDDFSKEETKMMESGKEKDRVYMNVHNSFAKKGLESKTGSGQTFNAVTLPKGSIVDGKDLGGGTIYPLDMYIYPNKFNPNLTTVQFKPDQDVQVNFRDGEKVKVKADALCEGVDAANKKYLNQNKDAAVNKQRDKEKDVEL